MIRSLLYIPASSERFIAKAHERGADAIILDLEDSVAEPDKDKARAGLADAIPLARQRGARIFVRVNHDPERVTDDVEAAVRAGADGLMLPKTESADDLARLAALLEPLEAAIARLPFSVIGLIESPAAVLDARAIARGPRLMALAVGGEDLALAMGAGPTSEVLRFPKLLVHYAAKAEGLMSIGLLRTVADYSDHAAIRAAGREARDFGFDGATCVHPAVVPLLNEAFTASETDLAWARRVVEAAGGQPGAFALDGQMIDAPVLARARRLLEEK
ncbi:HpcH/HpaI aldolase/citrate lyase family protein [Devosia nitrariae]|uniref:CoA ester lyase n=1 Tax=Devosia nitrariae TaxID=2071872 RepID=A0ABQ5W4H4_9HYPH|nr:CoA ester lyase [Devosia nitrariae]GLQ54816.1 CoA ester lyase [Devosia nitrariae]